MSKNVTKSLKTAWNKNTPEMTLLKEGASDALPATSLSKLLNALKKVWETQFDGLAKEVSREFALRAEKRGTSSLQQILKEGGFGVKFSLTPQLEDILKATIQENVSLIKSIQAYYFTDVETIIMQGVKNGRDFAYIEKELQAKFGVTERRANIIARDQTNKANEAISRARMLEAGIEEASWVHISGKKESRKTHMQMQGKVFKLTEGLYDSDVKRKVQPGELINCNCTFRPVIPGGD